MMNGWAENPSEPRLFHLSGSPEVYILASWLCGVGDSIHAPQVIATIETKTFTLELEVFESGILAEQCFAVGDAIPDGSVIARITPLKSAV